MRISDWSSDVCSSDLLGGAEQLLYLRIGHFRMVLQQPGDGVGAILALRQWGVLGTLGLLALHRHRRGQQLEVAGRIGLAAGDFLGADLAVGTRIERSEERRGGKEGSRTCRCRWSPDNKKK